MWKPKTVWSFRRFKPLFRRLISALLAYCRAKREVSPQTNLALVTWTCPSFFGQEKTVWMSNRVVFDQQH